MKPTAPAVGRRSFTGLVAVAATVALMLFVSCATMPVRPTATLQVICSVPDATLWMDDQLMGRVGEWKNGRPMPAGFRRIEIRHPSYFTFFAELSSRQGEAVVVRADLRPQLD